MVEIAKYHLPPTELVPNSPRPLLHYKKAISPGSAVDAWNLFTNNGWHVSWIFRYGATQASHYHSKAHECMAVLSGTATIRFGVADTSDDLEASTSGSAREPGGVELRAEAGDVFVIPAGVAHKTFGAKPEAGFALLTPGAGRGLGDADPREVLEGIELTGFTMLGAYSGGDWDFVKGGGRFETSWGVAKPELDPVFGLGDEGLCKTWPGTDRGADVEEVVLE
ncbi:hypothetical protein B0T11DRAFT_352105 [Plectosphaerella cucumerina]|jgi:uncharacterized protein YjlB|uniref:Cupin type-1 domain-containing protein n=1 Tax=Plectosphaerella cucumerina TaxID=40658 RepID=A0A8K0TF11_9PEZI|nr:hypothetical protein B0T11DRAFT_352105 [Plectosphaerella cucumerina]